MNTMVISVSSIFLIVANAKFGTDIFVMASLLHCWFVFYRCEQTGPKFI